MKSFTVESILGVSHEKTLSVPVCVPVQHDVTSQHHILSSDEAATTRQQQLFVDQGSFFSAVNFFLCTAYYADSLIL